MTFPEILSQTIDLLNDECVNLVTAEFDPRTGGDRGAVVPRDHAYWDALADAAHALVTVREMYKERNK